MCLFARSCSQLQPIEPTVDPNMSASLEERECEPAKVIVAVKITSLVRIPRCSLPLLSASNEWGPPRCCFPHRRFAFCWNQPDGDDEKIDLSLSHICKDLNDTSLDKILDDRSRGCPEKEKV
jgi:hypothetical protein